MWVYDVDIWCGCIVWIYGVGIWSVVWCGYMVWVYDVGVPASFSTCAMMSLQTFRASML